MKTPAYILPVIVFAQFCCTSLWFAGNSIMTDLSSAFMLPEGSLGHLTAVVQLGFITGTLVFAALSFADRFSPSKVFLISALLGALVNLGTIWEENSLNTLLVFRFSTGFFLAGIYPVGMKIASDYYQKGLGKSLGYLVGALVLGTAFPHLIKALGTGLPWRAVLMATSSLACLGGLLIWRLVPDGPHRKPSAVLDWRVTANVFNDKQFRTAAFGYFGHMWELYTFWAFVPAILLAHHQQAPQPPLNIPAWSFIIIGLGGLACIIGGYLAERWGTKKIAVVALTLSCLCCLISPLFFQLGNRALFLSFLVFWGAVVIADSPLFSTLVAQQANPNIKGTALTLVTCIGFAITIVSIQLINWLQAFVPPNYLYLPLALGPLLGLWVLRKKG